MTFEESDDISTLNSALWTHIADRIGLHQRGRLKFRKVSKIPGGDINTSWALAAEKITFFVKVNERRFGNILRCEAKGLKTLAATKSIATPGVLFAGSFETYSYLVLEYLPLQSAGDERQLGRQLAQLHRNLNPKGTHYFGYEEDNFIGLTPQSNRYHGNWASFWSEQRLRPQLHLAAKSNTQPNIVEKGHRLLENIDGFFEDYSPRASLLHGDLWSGNKGYAAGRAYIFDPAVYYGDRETDLALSELFGGFSEDFYRGYQDTWPLDPGYRRRKPLYQLYHLLNHLNLFGSAYADACLGQLTSLLHN